MYPIVVEYLTKARALIDTPEKWTKHESARDVNGEPVLLDSDQAVCFCLSAAIERVLVDTEDEEAADIALDILERAASSISPFASKSLSRFNDYSTTKHADVLAACDLAIERAKAQLKEADNA